MTCAFVDPWLRFEKLTEASEAQTPFKVQEVELLKAFHSFVQTKYEINLDDDLFRRIESRWQLISYFKTSNGTIASKLEPYSFEMREDIKMIWLEVKQVFFILSICCGSAALRVFYENKMEVRVITNSLMQIIKDLLMFKSEWNTVPWKKTFETLEEKLSVLRYFTNEETELCRCHEKFKDLSVRIESVAEKVAYLSYIYLLIDMDEKNEHSVDRNFYYLLHQEVNYKITSDLIGIYVGVLEALQKASPSSAPTWIRSPNPTNDGRVFPFVEHFLKVWYDLRNSKHNWLFPWEKEVASLEKKMQSLRTFIRFTASSGIHQHEKLGELMAFIEAAAEKAAPLPYLYNLLADRDWSIQMQEELDLILSNLLEMLTPDDPKVSELYIGVLQDSKLSRSTAPIDNKITADFVDTLLDNLAEQLSNKTSLADSFKYHVQKLDEELRCLKNFIMTLSKGYPHHWRVRNLWIDIAVVAREAGLFIYSLNEKRMKENDAVEIKLQIFNLQDKIKLITGKSSRSVPRTDELGYFESVLRRLEELLNCKAPHAITAIKNQLEKLEKDLVHLRNYLRAKANLQHNEDVELKDLWRRIIELGYKTEYAIDMFMVDKEFVLPDAVDDEIKHIRKEVEEISSKSGHDAGVPHSVDNPSVHRSSLSYTGSIDDLVVGFEDEARTVIDKLVESSMQLGYVSIVGMAGLGKTTLAKKVYSDDFVVGHFQVRAWCNVSQKYQRREMLLELLSHVVEDTGALILGKNDDEIGTVFYHCLIKRCYLIVMDDIWDIEAWKAIKRYFPNDSCGSRVMFTTRIRSATPDSYLHDLRPLSEDESWRLLQKKLMFEEKWTDKLLEVGKRIARNCQGLPLLVVLVAGLLARTVKKPELWGKVAERIIGNPNKFSNIMQLSYEQLPDYLKPCFLYFGAFAKNKAIQARKLIWLWVGEGFVQKINEGEDPVDVAEQYLIDLVQRSLVRITKSQSTGKVKTCRVHDLLIDFCLQKSEEENFSLLIDDGDDEFSTASGEESSVDPSLYQNFDHRRLFIYSGQKRFVASRPSGPPTRSLLLFSPRGNVLRSHDVSFICHSFKLIRVLDLGCITMAFCEGIKLMIHLTYLAIRMSTNSIPSYISELCNLETFLVHGMRGEVVLPDTIWSMEKLRHLHISDRCSFSLGESFLENCSKLENLDTISTPSFLYGKESEMTLKRLSGVRKMRCIFLDCWDYTRNCNKFPVLNSLSKLESLKVFYHGLPQYPCVFNFPRHLKRLTLSKFRLPWSEVSKIGRLLPELEVLKLLCNACEGSVWDTQNDEDFENLKFLKLELLNLSAWNISSSDHFPQLQHVVLQSCKQIEEIPSTLWEIQTMQMIEVRWCSRESVRSAQENQNEYEVEGLKLRIHPSDGIDMQLS